MQKFNTFKKKHFKFVKEILLSLLYILAIFFKNFFKLYRNKISYTKSINSSYNF